MANLENGIKKALIEYGAMNENWRLEITDKKIIGNSDYATISVMIFKPRCRKPCMMWELHVNIVREFVDFERSIFARL